MVTVLHHTPVAKCCTIFKQFDELNFDGLAEKRQNFLPSKPVFRYTVIWDAVLSSIVGCYL